MRDGEWLLFDCGEGTQTQISRAKLNPSKLTAIFITHLHGDHFNGLAGLLRHLEPDGLSSLLLSHGRPIDRIAARCDVLDLERDDIAAAQLAVYGKIEHR